MTTPKRTLTARTLFPVLLALLVPALVFAGGYNLAGVGAKALAMSGAFRAISDDYSATYWNPAGLAGQPFVATLDGKVLYPMVWLTPNVSSPYAGYEGYRNGVEQTTDAKAYPAPTFGLTYPVNAKFTAALGVFAPSALGAEWSNLFTGPPYGYNNTVAYPAKAWSSSLKVIDFHPTVAYRVNEKLSLGLGISADYGDVEIRSPKLSPSGAPFPYQAFYVDATLKGTGWGFGFNVGAMYDVCDNWKLGVSYRGPVEIAVEGNVEQTLILPSSAGIRAADPSKAALFNGGSLSASPEATADFPLPADAGLGISYRCCEKWLLAADVVWTNWGSIEDVTIDMSGNGPTGAPATDSELILRYKDTYKISLGADYLLNPEKDLHVRCGYYFDPTPIPDGSLRPSITDVADKHNISLGFSCAPAAHVILEGYYERIMTGTRTVKSTDMDGDSVADNLGGDWKVQVDTFGLSIGYKF